MRILIICTGNSCRSQMAHGILQSLDKNLEVHSAGTKPAIKVNPLAVKVMEDIGYDISNHYPKSVKAFLNDQWDYVITVCGGAKETCPTFIGTVGKHLHFGFDDPSNAIGTDEYIMSEFCRVRNEIKKKFSEFYITEILNRGTP